MKKTLTYTADRGYFLTLKNLRDFATDAALLDCSDYAQPKLVIEERTGPDKGRIKKITAERQVF